MSTKTIFGLEIVPVRRYCGRHEWTLSIMNCAYIVNGILVKYFCTPGNASHSTYFRQRRTELRFYCRLSTFYSPTLKLFTLLPENVYP